MTRLVGEMLLGGLLAVRVVGTGPPLVVLGGLAPERTRPAGLAVRQEVQPWARLAGDRTVYALRWRPTPRTPPAPAMADVAADVASALQTAFGGPVDLLGVSTGGSIAQQVAIDRPDLVGRLVLVATAHRLGPAAADAQARALAHARAGQHPRAWQALAEGMVRRGVRSHALGALSSLTAGPVPSSMQSLMAAENGFDAGPSLGRIRAPTLVVAGDRDRSYPRELVALTAAGIPGARLALLPGRSHLGSVSDPRLLREVRDFLGLAGSPVQRVSEADLAMLAMDVPGGLRNQFGAVLVLDGAPEPMGLERLVAARLATVARLRQRPVPVPWGAGRPVWLEDPAFRPEDNVGRVSCPAPGDETALLEVAAGLVTRPLPPDRPPWRATVVTGLSAGRSAVVVVLHHVLADGVGGLALLGRLVDEQLSAPPAQPTVRAPAPGRAYVSLVADAWTQRWRLVSRLSTLFPQLRHAVQAGGGVRLDRAEDCSLFAPTGVHRRLAVARADLAGLRAAAHRCGGTVNDAVLSAVAGALLGLLRLRGESVSSLRVGVMVGARRTASSEDPSNAATPLVVGVPADPDSGTRLAGVAGSVRARRSSATGPSLATLLGPLFRAAAARGGYRWYLRRQRRLHVLLSNVPGPDHEVSLAGVPVRALVPIAAAEAGDVPLSFLVLSYAGTVVVTVVADSESVPDLPELRSALQRELDALTLERCPVRPGPG